LYVLEQKRLDEQMRGYKQEIEANLENRVSEILKLKEELRLLESRNS
jgi:hypothetical protein